MKQLRFRHTLTGWVALVATALVGVGYLYGFSTFAPIAGFAFLLVAFTQLSGIDQRR